MAREKKIDLVILGLLSHEDMTGYDIKKRIDGAISFFWKGSFGNIYPALKDLESEKKITRKEVSGSGREKITYHITKEGKAALSSWIREEQASNEIRYETLLKLFFGGTESKQISLHNIEVFEKKVQHDLEMLTEYSDSLEKYLNNEDHMYYYLTASFGIETYKAYLTWCEKAKGILLQQTATKKESMRS